MPDPDFGLTINRLDDEPRPAVGGNMSTVGLVVTAPTADATVFPENTAIRFNSADKAFTEKLGTDGSQLGQIDLINQQLDGKSADIVLVRVAPGVDLAATQTALLNGLQVLKDSPAETGVTPRLVGVPSFTHQQATPTTENPVVAGMNDALTSLKAHAVCSGPHTTQQAYIDWRETISNGRIIPVETWVKWGPNAVEIDSVGGVIGMMIARDHANGGRPFKSAANRPMQGIVGANRAIKYDMTDGATEGQIILEKDGAIIVKGEAGVAGSLAEAGLTFIGYATASGDDLWRFYNQTRGRDYIELTMQATTSYYLGKYNITQRAIDLIMQAMDGILRDLKATGDIIDYRVGFEPDKNSPENLRLGKLRTLFRAEEPPVLRHLTIDSGRYREALTTLAENIAA